ncbi:MAG: methylmalonyl-CoA epimerase [Elusimicrobiota bacterium]
MRLDHIAIAVPDLEEALKVYRDALGLALTHSEEVAAQKVRVAFLRGSSGDGTCVELLAPTSPDGAVAKFLGSKGPGLHHLALRVDDIEASMQRLRAMGKAPMEERPRAGAKGHKVCFLHPKHAGGVLIELVEHGEE